MGPTSSPPHTVGRYLVGGVVAQGGMATVHLGRLRGAAGFSRIVAVKRMLPHFSRDPDFASMFFDEARLAARVRHPNVVPTLDVVMERGELCIVMEYVEGATLAELGRLAKGMGECAPTSVAAAIVRDALQGLHAAHEACDAEGRPLGIVHRDVSPQNVLVGTDGVARVLDFGIAKANVRLHETREGGGLKGKLAYMAPEQLDGSPVDRASDVFAASVVLWETLTGERLYAGTNEGAIVNKLLNTTPSAPSAACPALGKDYDALVLRGLARAPGARFETARAMAVALGEAGPIASAAEVGAWVERVAARPLAERRARVRELETMMHRDVEPGDAAAHDPERTHPATLASPALAPRPADDLATMAAVTTEPPKRSRKGVLLGLALAGAVVLVAALGVFAARPSPSASSAQPAAGGAASSAPAVSAQATPTATDTPTPTPSPSATAAAPPSATASLAARRPSAPPPQGRPVTHPPPASIPDHL